MEVYDIAASYFILLFYMVITLLFLQYIAKGKRQTGHTKPDRIISKYHIKLLFRHKRHYGILIYNQNLNYLNIQNIFIYNNSIYKSI